MIETVPEHPAIALSGLSDLSRIGSTETWRSTYKSAKPFPHLVVEHLFADEMLDQLVEEIKTIGGDNWVHHEEHQEKFNLRSAVGLGETGFQLTALLHSAPFLYFLSELTGIWNLVPDPYLQGGGYHKLPVGGYFDIHVDRNTAYINGLTRRLALIIYLNKSWPHEYGGQLELWNETGTRCESVVEPLFNRTILFEIGDRNFHGVPARVNCPLDRSRNSFVVYYHTTRTDGPGNVAPHNSLYSPVAYRRPTLTFAGAIKEIMPPLVWRGLRQIKLKMML